MVDVSAYTYGEPTYTQGDDGFSVAILAQPRLMNTSFKLPDAVRGYTFVALRAWLYVRGHTCVAIRSWLYVLGYTFVAIRARLYVRGYTFVATRAWQCGSKLRTLM